MKGLAQRLVRQDIAVGTWITLRDVAITEIACKSGLSWIAVDLEHSTLTDHDFERHARIAGLCGIPCLARVPSIDPHQIKRLLDAGAAGLILANVQSKAEIDLARQVMMYPPLGSRGVGLGRAHAYGSGFSDYLCELESLLLIAQIEHADALEKLDEIMSHPALDAWMIGPYDLSASLGYPGEFNHSTVTKAIHAIEEAGERHQAAPGLHIVEPSPDELHRVIQRGYRFIAFTVDFRALDVAFRTGAGIAASYATDTKQRESGEDTAE